jgi:type IV pilus assembly protein PilA
VRIPRLAKLKRDRGFTLTELAVAMLVVGILAAIAVPSFLGARNTAFDKEAQATVDAALVAAKVYYSMYGDFSDPDSDACESSIAFAAGLQKIDPNYDFIVANIYRYVDSPRVVSAAAAITRNSGNESLGCQAFMAAALSRSGNCWIGRITIEGKYIGASSFGTDAPIQITAIASTDNASEETLAAESVNGTAYAAWKVRSSDASGGSATGDGRLFAAAHYCRASSLLEAASTTEATFWNRGPHFTEYYDTWRTVAGADEGGH